MNVFNGGALLISRANNKLNEDGEFIYNEDNSSLYSIFILGNRKNIHLKKERRDKKLFSIPEYAVISTFIF